MNNIQPLMWRKGILLSATFLFALLLGTACKKKENILGQNTINQNELLNSDGIDTFSLVTYSFLEDSVISDNPAFGILGSYHDPVFGLVSSEIYTQLRLSGLSPNFGDVNTITVDSVVLGLEYAGFYGEIGPQFIEVFKIEDTDGLSLDSTYYSFSTKATSSTSLVQLGAEVIDMDPNGQSIIGTDTVDRQIRIPLDTMVGWDIINEADQNSSTFSSNENFLEFFKGLRIKTNNGVQAAGEGGMFYFNITDPLSKMTIYYTQGGDQKAFDLVINSECADFNHVEIDDTNTSVETVINDTISGQTEFYAQAFGTRARVEIPGISNIPPNAVVHKATLELPVQHHALSPYTPGLDISVATYAKAGDSQLLSVNVLGNYDESYKRFTIDLRGYTQAVINGEVENTGLVLSPILFITASDRIVFNGPLSTNKDKPRFSIVYTEF